MRLGGDGILMREDALGRGIETEDSVCKWRFHGARIRPGEFFSPSVVVSNRESLRSGDFVCFIGVPLLLFPEVWELKNKSSLIWEGAQREFGVII